MNFLVGTKKNEINNVNLLGYTTYIVKKKKIKVSFKTFTLKCNLYGKKQKIVININFDKFK